MASHFAVILRDPKSNVYSFEISSWDISWIVNNLRFLSKDPKHIVHILDTHRVTVNLPLAPLHNGLTVLDMVRDKILNFQEVANSGKLYSVGITEAAHELIEENGGDPHEPKNIKKAYEGKGKESDHYTCVRFREFMEAGKIKRAYNHLTPANESISIEGKTFVEWDRYFRWEHKATGPIVMDLDMRPYETVQYQAKNLQAAQAVKKAMIQLGFQITAEDNRVWDQWIKDICQ